MMSAKDDVCLLVNIRRLMVPSIESIASMQELKAGTSALIEHLEPLSSAVKTFWYSAMAVKPSNRAF